MAWTTPKTWAPSEVLASADMNLYIRDNLLALKSPPSAEVYSTTGFTTTSTTFVDVDASLNLSITTTGGWVLVLGNFNASGTGMTSQWLFDGVAYPVAATGTLLWRWFGPAAGVHTFKPQWKVTSGTGTMSVCYVVIREVS